MKIFVEFQSIDSVTGDSFPCWAIAFSGYASLPVRATTASGKYGMAVFGSHGHFPECKRRLPFWTLPCSPVFSLVILHLGFCSIPSALWRSTDFDGSCCFWADFDYFLFLYLKFWERGCLIQFPTFLFDESLSLYIQYNFCYFRIHHILLNYKHTHPTSKWYLHINVCQSTREGIYCFCFCFLTFSTLVLTERIHLFFLLLIIAFVLIIFV